MNDPIAEFLETYKEKKNSHKCHRLNLKYYFNYVKVDPSKYFKKKRDYSTDYEEYAKTMTHLSRCTRASRLGTVKLFLEENDITIPKKTLRRTKIKNKPQTIDEIPSIEQLKQILSHGNCKDRAWSLFAATSGCRIQEILQLKFVDVPSIRKLERNEKITFPVKVYIRGEISKNEEPRITFISSECWETLIEWLRERENYLNTAAKRINHKYKKDTKDDRIFPFSYSVAYKGWHRLLTKADFLDKENKVGIDPSTGIARMHLHVLRAFFKNRLISANVQERYIETILGHIGYVGGAYDKYDEKTLADAYSQGEHALLVFTSIPDLSGVTEQLKEKDTEIKDLKQQMHDIRMELLEVKLKQVQELQRKKG